MIDIQDRRYLAQCTQQLRSSALAGLLDLLLMKHPSEVVERKGGESYHVDFGTLSSPAYAEAREFIKKALGDDDDAGISENERKRMNAISGSSANVTEVKPSASVTPASIASPPPVDNTVLNGSHHPQATTASSLVSSLPVPPTHSLAPLAITNVNATPSIPYPGAPSSLSAFRAPGDVSNTNMSPEMSTRKQLKRARLVTTTKTGREEEEVGTRRRTKAKQDKTSSSSASSSTAKHDSSRYYNGERVWRSAEEDLHLDFHGVDVILLSLRTDTKRPWKCGTCEKAFVSKDKIVNHVQQHSGEKIHECPTCRGRFSSKHYLKEHQKRVHLFHCHSCDHVFDTFDELHRHAGEEHPDQTTTVRECSCKKGCNNSRCGCFKNGFNCTQHCQCLNCNNLG